jgi:polysaccharide pyruvyl transferase WcaK-like protein
MVVDRRAGPSKVGIFGTFDVPNFGDLLFPLIAQKRLGALLPVEIAAGSPAGGAPIWDDCYPSTPLGFQGLDGVLVGGGNIIRMSAATLDEYQINAAAIAGYPMLWAGPINFAGEGKPVCWNAPGVPEPFPPFQHALVRTAMEAASYLSVRDEDSRRLLLDIWPDAAIDIVPDTAWDIPMLWSDEELNRSYRDTVGHDSTPTIAVHLNARYLGASEKVVAEYLDTIAKQTRSVPVLMAMGPCHGDDVLARRMSSLMSVKPVVIDTPSSLLQIAACIARSAAYLGSSMHGFITAAAFGVPALAVASQSVRKFAGLQTLLSPSQILAGNWAEARDWAATEAGRNDVFAAKKIEIRKSLDAHWDKIASAFTAREGARRPAVANLNEQIFAATLQDLVGRYRKQQAKLKPPK